jgi:hypothetical protein
LARGDVHRAAEVIGVALSNLLVMLLLIANCIFAGGFMLFDFTLISLS